jgi:hypothetical protein
LVTGYWSPQLNFSHRTFEDVFTFAFVKICSGASHGCDALGLENWQYRTAFRSKPAPVMVNSWPDAAPSAGEIAWMVAAYLKFLALEGAAPTGSWMLLPRRSTDI